MTRNIHKAFAESNLDYDSIRKWAHAAVNDGQLLRSFDHEDRIIVTDGILVIEAEPDLLKMPSSVSVKYKDDDKKARATAAVLPVLNARRLPASWDLDTMHSLSSGRWVRIVTVREGTRRFPCAFDQHYCSLLTPEPPIMALRMTKRVKWYKPDHYPITGGSDRIRWLLMPVFLNTMDREALSGGLRTPDDTPALSGGDGH